MYKSTRMSGNFSAPTKIINLFDQTPYRSFTGPILIKPHDYNLPDKSNVMFQIIKSHITYWIIKEMECLYVSKHEAVQDLYICVTNSYKQLQITYIY